MFTQHLKHGRAGTLAKGPGLPISHGAARLICSWWDLFPSLESPPSHLIFSPRVRGQALSSAQPQIDQRSKNLVGKARTPPIVEDTWAQEFLLGAAPTQVSAFAWTAGASALDSAPGHMDTKSQGQFKTARGSGAGCVHGKCPEPASPSTESGSLLSLQVTDSLSTVSSWLR